MSDEIQSVDLDSEDVILNTPPGLREYAKSLKAQLESRNTEFKSLQDMVAANALTDALSGFKNPERVKRDLLSDKINPLDKAALDKWLADNSSDYAQADGNPAPVQEAGHTQVPQDEANAQRRMQALGNDFRAPADMSKLEAALSDVSENATKDELLAAYRKHGL